MRNKRMQKKLEENDAIDVSKWPRTPEGYYEVPEDIDVEEMDFCNQETEEWIWSIGERKSDGKRFASHISVFYRNPDYNCLWLR
jgi:hypothetical protein